MDIAARLLTSPSGLHPQIKAPDTSELSENWIASTGHNLRRKQKEAGAVNMLMFVFILYMFVLMHKLQLQRYHVIHIHEYLDDVVITCSEVVDRS